MNSPPTAARSGQGASTGGKPRSDVPIMLDVAAVAAYTGWSERLVRELRFQRKLPAVRVGKKVWFRRTDVDRFIAEQFIAEQFGTG